MATTRSRKPRKSSRPAPPPPPPPAEIERMPLAVFTEKAYLDYSMYVILDRALPHVADGLKPVQRRIVYAMSELALSASAKYKKSARTVGDVIGKFHPHGDSACYEAMVLMSQPFSYRYPLIDGQGNWGSQDDPKSFAAMRYTEARLTRYADSLLSELGQGTSEWTPNFDGTLEEPVLLPARLPNVLLNGASGIAVGLATDIPPHNAREVVAACVRLLEDKSASVAQLMEHVQGPDFPTAAEIVTPREELRRMYETGSGSVRQRATWEPEHGEIVITALPYQVSGSRVLEQIAAQMAAKKLPMVEDLRDESDHESPTRLVIVPRSNRVDHDELMAHLFATTDLERAYRVNMNAIGLDGRPHQYDLRGMLVEWLTYRGATVKRRLEHRLDKISRRLHVLDGLLIAFLNIDEVIAIIRREDEPKPVLIKRFGLSDTQAEAILELKLRHLAKLEEMKIRGEQGELANERAALEKTLASKTRLKNLVRDELIADAEAYGDARHSPLVERAAARAIDTAALAPAEPVTVVVSERGWIRSAKGHEIDPGTLAYRSGDAFLQAARGRSNQLLVVIDSTGRTYGLNAQTLPSARSLGEPLSSLTAPPAGADFAGVMLGDPGDRYLLSNDAGYGFIATLGELAARNRSGKACLRVPEGARVLPPQRVTDPGEEWLAVASDDGRMLVYLCGELPELNKGKGVRLMGIRAAKGGKPGEHVAGLAVFREGDHLVVRAGKRHTRLKPDEIDRYLGERAQRGLKLPQGFRQVATIEVISREG